MVLHGIFYHIIGDTKFLTFNGPVFRMLMVFLSDYMIEPIVSLSKFDFFFYENDLFVSLVELLCPFKGPILKFDVLKFNVKSGS